MEEENLKAGSEYEQLIYRIYKELAPNADVRINDKIYGRDSGIEREIDVSIRTTVVDHEILIIIQAKDYKAKADVRIVGEFASVIKDVGASKGILICRGGFTSTAKTLAKSYKIDLYSAHDATNIKWQTEIQIPLIWESYDFKDYRYQWRFDGAVNAKTHLPVNEDFKINLDLFQLSTLFETESGEKTNFINIFIEQWDRNDSWRQAGEHKFTYPGTIKFFSQGCIASCSRLSFTYTFVKRNFFKYVTPIEYQGIKNHETNSYKFTKIGINEKVHFLDDGTWKQVNLNKLAIETFFINMEVLDFGIGKFIRLKTESKI